MILAQRGKLHHDCAAAARCGRTKTGRLRVYARDSYHGAVPIRPRFRFGRRRHFVEERT